MVETIKLRIIRRGGVYPPALETQRFTAKFVNLWLLYLSGGGNPSPTNGVPNSNLSVHNFLFIKPSPKHYPIKRKIKNAKT